MFSDEKIAEVRERANLVDIVGEYVSLKRAGVNYKGVCPFHADSDPSFNVHPIRQFFHCFGCGASGDVFSFIQRIEGLSFIDTARRLAERVGVELPDSAISDGDRQQRDRRRDERTRRLYVLETATVFYEHMLWGDTGQPGRMALEQRGISEDTAKCYRLGYAPDEWQSLLTHFHDHGITAKEAESAGLVLPRKSGNGYYDRFRNRLVFTITDASGHPIAFSARVLSHDDSGAKYVNSPETPDYSKGKVLYGLHPARVALSKADEAILVEGNFDVVAMHEAGFQNTVAPLGTAFTEEQAVLLRRRVENVCVMFDGDSAGMKAAVRAFPILAGAGLRAYMAPLPSGEDPDSLVRQKGADAIQRLLDGRKGLLDEIISMAASASNGSAQDVAARISKLRPLLGALKDAMARDLYRQKVAAAFGVDPSLVFRYLRGDVKVQTVSHKDHRRSPLPGNTGERELIGLLLDVPQLCAKAEELDLISLMQTPQMRHIAEQLIRNAHHHSSSSATLVEGGDTDPVTSWFAKRALESEFQDEESGSEALLEIKDDMEKDVIRRQVEEIDKHIQKAHVSGDDMMIFTLQRKKAELQKQIHGVNRAT